METSYLYCLSKSTPIWCKTLPHIPHCCWEEVHDCHQTWKKCLHYNDAFQNVSIVSIMSIINQLNVCLLWHELVYPCASAGITQYYWANTETIYCQYYLGTATSRRYRYNMWGKGKSVRRGVNRTKYFFVKLSYIMGKIIFKNKIILILNLDLNSNIVIGEWKYKWLLTLFIMWPI